MYIGGDEAKSRLLVYKIGADVKNILAAFNAKNASCYHARDRDRLLGIVESGFGDLTLFTSMMRGMLTAENVSRGTINTRESLSV